MEVPKFALDRNSYLSTAATAGSLYESSKAAQASAAYSAYLDPSVLTKAYFDSKMYQDRAANYAFDITKIYGAQQHNSSAAAAAVAHQHHQQHNLLNGLGIASPHNSNNASSNSNNNNNNNVDERDNSPHLDTGGNSSSGPISGLNDTKAHMHSPNDSQLEYSQYAQQYNQSAAAFNNGSLTTAAASTNAAVAASVTSASSGDFRRPLTVIF